MRVPSAVSTSISTPSPDLGERRHPRRELDLGVRKFLQPLDRHAGELVLLALHGERVGRLVLEDAEIEFGDDLLARAVPDAEQRLDQAALDHLVDHAEPGQHFQRRGVGGCRARHVVDLGFGLEHVDRQALAGERQRCDDADRPAAGDEDGTLCCHLGLSYYCSFTPAIATASAHSLEIGAISSANCAGVMPDGSAPSVRQLSTNSGSFAGLGDLGRDLVDDRLRRGRRRHQAVPGDGLVAGIAELGDGRHVRKPAARAPRSTPRACGSRHSGRAAARRTGWRTWSADGRR